MPQGCAMPVYQYRVRDRKGQLEQGQIEAEDLRKAVETLRNRGYFVVEVRQPGQGLQKEIRLPSLGGRIGLKQVAVFARQMATLIQAGVTITEPLSQMPRISMRGGSGSRAKPGTWPTTLWYNQSRHVPPVR